MKIKARHEKMQNAKCKIVLFDCRGDHRSSEVVSVTVAHPSVTKKHDLQKPSPAEKVLRNEADEGI